MLFIFIILLILLLVLNYFDAFTTRRIVEAGSHRNERNPIARWLIKKYGVFKGIMIIKSIIILLLPLIFYAYVLSQRDTVYTLVLANAIYLFVVINNINVAKKMNVSLKFGKNEV
ncbi:MAG TPA: DUF5658 family protein [Candidatus Cloacimonadota bacterium]|nr:DUF5658 family protein [Candidatus Cloacimonadota bacterium]